MHKRMKTSENFAYITAVPTHSLIPGNIQKEKTQTELHELYNRLHNQNKNKRFKVANLKRMIQVHKQAFLRTSEAGSEPILSLTQKIHKKEEICEDQLAEQTVLIHKKTKLKTFTEQMRGKLIELQKDYERITNNHSAFNNSSFASRYSLLLSAKALGDYEKHIEQARNLFKANSEKLQKRLKTASESNLLQNNRVHSVDLKIQEKRTQKKDFVNQYMMCLHDYKLTSQNRQASLTSLASYQQGFTFIRERIHKETPELQKLSDLHSEVIQKLIQKLKELEYNSASLNLTYEKMSEDEAKLNKELSVLKTELSTVKQAFEYSQIPPNEPLRYSNIIQKNYETEVAIIKIYFQTAEILYQSLEKLTNCKVDKEYEERLKDSMDLLKSIRIGSQKRKPFNLEKYVIEKLVGKNTYFETRLEIMNSIALSPHELQSIYSQIFANDPKTCKVFVSFVESCPIIKLFLDRDSLFTFLTKNFENSFFELLQDIGLTCTSRLLDRLKTLLLKTSEFLATLKNSLPNPNPESLHSLNPTLANRSHSQNVFPFKITEKFHKKTEKLKQETQTSQITPPNKPVPRLYSLSSLDLTRQKVMKEVLENQKKETLLRTTEKKIARTSTKLVQLPYMKRFVLRPLTDRLPNSLSSSQQNIYSH